jgi:hypothetical protein
VDKKRSSGYKGDVMSSIKDMVEYVVKSFTDRPDAIDVSETISDTTVLIEVDAADEDKGRIIGRRGRTINAIRDIARVHGGKLGKKVEVEIL